MTTRDNIKYLAVACSLKKEILFDHYIDEQNKIFAEDVFLFHIIVS